MDNKHNKNLLENVCFTYGKDLQKFIYTLSLRDQGDMEDIFQNTMEEAFRGLKYLRDVSKIKSWIFSIAKTEARRYYAANKKYYEQEFCELSDIDSALGDSDDFTETVLDSNSLKQILNDFSDDTQQIFLLHYYYDIPLVEISEILNINYNTIRSIHNRGISKMKKIYQEKGI